MNSATRVLVLGLSSLLALGCKSESAAPDCTDDECESCEIGEETCECYPNDTCNGELECFSDICVDPDATGGTLGTDKSVDASAGDAGPRDNGTTASDDSTGSDDAKPASNASDTSDKPSSDEDAGADGSPSGDDPASAAGGDESTGDDSSAGGGSGSSDPDPTDPDAADPDSAAGAGNSGEISPPSQGECDSDEHCTGSEAICDSSTHTCVACLIDSHCAGGGICIAGACQSSGGCSSDDDCGDLYCDVWLGACVECVDDGTCKDNQICRNAQCTDLCGNSLDCEVGNVCDNGWCDQCTMNADCEDGQGCYGRRCHTLCESDNDCTPQGQICDFGAGVCAECLQLEDCASGEYCDAGTCQPQRCIPGKGTCDGSDVHECVDGSLVTFVASCSTAQVCVERAGKAECVEALCTPGLAGCSDPGAAFLCGSDGLSYADVSLCADGEGCVAGECMPVVCEAAGALFCTDPDTVLLCLDDRTSASVADECENSETCEAGACMPVLGYTGNLIENGDFSAGLDRWKVIDVSEYSLVDSVVTSTDGQLCVTLNSSEPYVILGWPAADDEGVILTDANYELTFDAWADETDVVLIEYKVGEVVSPFEAHDVGEIEPDLVAREYGETLTPQHSERSGIALLIQLLSSTTVEVCVDNVVLKAIP